MLQVATLVVAAIADFLLLLYLLTLLPGVEPRGAGCWSPG